MSDILDRVFGADPDPMGSLPARQSYGDNLVHTHTWMTREAGGIPYWECTTNALVCRATRTDPPEDL